jgi:hypothetical protein
MEEGDYFHYTKPDFHYMAVCGARTFTVRDRLTNKKSFGPKETRVGLIRRQEDKTRGSPKDGRTSLPNNVIAEMRRPDNVSTAIPLAWYRPVWGSRT